MSHIAKAQSIFHEMRAASLGTLDSAGAPFVSMVTVSRCGSSPVMLLSGLAMHTKNLVSDSRCSLLLVEPGGEDGNPLEGARLTLTGRAICLERGSDDAERQVFLQRHPSAAMYVDFGDFAFYQFEVDASQLVAGFGRIERFTASELAG